MEILQIPLQENVRTRFNRPSKSGKIFPKTDFGPIGSIWHLTCESCSENVFFQTTDSIIWRMIYFQPQDQEGYCLRIGYSVSRKGVAHQITVCRCRIFVASQVFAYQTITRNLLIVIQWVAFLYTSILRNEPKLTFLFIPKFRTYTVYFQLEWEKAECEPMLLQWPPYLTSIKNAYLLFTTIHVCIYTVYILFWYFNGDTISSIT